MAGLGRVRRVDVMLLGTVLLWALNITVTRYVVTHGFRPLAYGTTRYLAAALLAIAFALAIERSLRIGRRDVPLVLAAALTLYVNQVCFVNSVHLTNATTVALILGVTPVFTGLVAVIVGLERVSRAFWVAAALSFAGVALVALGAGGGLSGNLFGDLLALGTAATWAAYSVEVAPLMRRHSPYRISALVLIGGWVPLAITGSGQVAAQNYSLSTPVWLLFVYAVIGPLFLTNILWYASIGRVGPSRASLFANLEPFFAVLFALLLLSEHLTLLEAVGGLAIGLGIGIERRAHNREQLEPVA